MLPSSYIRSLLGEIRIVLSSKFLSKSPPLFIGVFIGGKLSLFLLKYDYFESPDKAFERSVPPFFEGDSL